MNWKKKRRREEQEHVEQERKKQEEERRKRAEEDVRRAQEAERMREEEEKRARVDMERFRKSASQTALSYVGAIERIRDHNDAATGLKVIERDCVGKKMSPYDWLMIPSDVSDETLKIANKRVCLVLHPDKVDVSLRSLAQACFVEMKKSYDLIKTPELRKSFDRNKGAAGLLPFPGTYFFQVSSQEAIIMMMITTTMMIQMTTCLISITCLTSMRRMFSFECLVNFLLDSEADLNNMEDTEDMEEETATCVLFAIPPQRAIAPTTRAKTVAAATDPTFVPDTR